MGSRGCKIGLGTARLFLFLKRATATTVLALSVCAPALAVTTSWNVNTSGTFTTTGNWSSGVPGSGDIAVFRRGTGISYTVTFPGSTPPATAISYTNDRLRVGNNHVTLARVNESAYGLQAGVFTHDQRRIERAFRGLEVGAVLINETSYFRIDNYPYGGVKDSGFGREGVRYAMESMTEPKVLVIASA